MSLDPRYVVQPVRKALQLLDVLVSEGRPMSLSELAERTALPKTTAFRYLYTLRSSGLVAAAEDGAAYTAGPRVASMPAPAAAIDALKEAALPEMQRLQLRYNETVNLGIADGPEIVYLAMIGSTRSLRMEAAPGTRDPLHSTSLGKAIMAARAPARRLEGLPRRLVKRTPRTLTSRAALARDLAQAAERGYVLDLEENELGAHCVAVMIPASWPAAALSISGPAQRMPEEALPRLGAALVRAAAAVAARLG
ncbi:IclR family transcriptional regulator [Geminicoccaceae bacterium 1502E]|nr:IclR family transcriptional regulator [Geminicoccaceae bacterium 1502E]